MLKILIIDNNVLFREGLSNLLQREAGVQVIGEAGSIIEAIEVSRGKEPSLALVEAELPDMDDFNGIRRLRQQQPNMQIVLIHAHMSEDYLIYAVRNGARGYVQKNCSLAKFMVAIRAIERGEAVIPRAMVGRLLDEFSRVASPVEQDCLNLLTPREVDVLCDLGRGHSNRQTAEHLQIAENTVKVHVHNILEKLNLRNRRQAARFARVNGIVSGNGSNSYPV